MLVINSFNLTSLYFRHLRTQPLIHIPVVTGPLAWNFVAVLSNGAAMVGAHSLAARILANVAIWSILLYGLFFMGAFKDYPIGFELTYLCACGCFRQPLQHVTHQANCSSLALALHQYGIRAFALQWIFALVIAGTLLAAALAISIPPVEMLCAPLCEVIANAIQIFGKELIWRRLNDDSDYEDREREPLLENE